MLRWIKILFFSLFLFSCSGNDEGKFHFLYSNNENVEYKLIATDLVAYNKEDIRIGDTIGTLIIKKVHNDPEYIYASKIILDKDISAVDYDLYYNGKPSPTKHFNEFYKFHTRADGEFNPGNLLPKILLGYNFNEEGTKTMTMLVKPIINKKSTK